MLYCLFSQDYEAERNMKEEECDYQDIKEEMTHRDVLAATYLLPNVRSSYRQLNKEEIFYLY